MQGPWPKVSWLSSMAWASWSEALAQRNWPSPSASMTPAASTPNNWRAATTASWRVLARSCWGWRSVRVPMLLASIEGSIGMKYAFRCGRRTGEPGQQAGTRVALDADQAQQPHEMVWACTGADHSQDPV